jgi:hypothetical protein
MSNPDIVLVEPDRALVIALLDRRGKLVDRLVHAIEHLPVMAQISLICAFMSTADLERVVRFQEVHG